MQDLYIGEVKVEFIAMTLNFLLFILVFAVTD